MSQEDEQAIVRVVARSRHRAAPGCPHRRPKRDGDVNAGMRFVDHPWPYLAPSDKTLDIEGPVRRGRQTSFIAGGDSRQRGPNWNGTHGSREVGVASDRPTAAGDGRSFDAEHLAQLLVVRFGAVQRGGKLLYPAVLDAQSGDFALESRHTQRVARNRSCQREKQDDQHGNRAGTPLRSHDSPAWKLVLFGFEIAVGVDDDRDAAGPLRHPSNGAPRMTASSRASAPLQ